MKSTNQTGSVPGAPKFTSEQAEVFQSNRDAMPASRTAILAEKISTKRYNWDPLAELLGDYTSPEDVSENLKQVYFEFSRLMILNPAEAPIDANNLLCQLQILCDVFHRMGKDGPGNLSLIPTVELDRKP